MKTIKKTSKGLILALLILFGSGNMQAQQSAYENWAKLNRYEKENKELINSDMEIKVVFMGNSITESWAGVRPQFFSENGFVGRGISGQTTPQFLLRFRNDVIDLNPMVVVINGGINDIAQNTEVYNPDYTLACIKSMTELADANEIDVILTSVLPAANIPWNAEIQDVPRKIEELNARIKEYADESGFMYVDYYSKMVDKNKAMTAAYTNDGVHVTEAGYKVMESIIKDAINELMVE